MMSNSLIVSPMWKPRTVELVLPVHIPELLRLSRCRSLSKGLRECVQEFCFMFYDVVEYSFVLDTLLSWRDSLSNDLLRSYFVDSSFRGGYFESRVRKSVDFRTVIIDEKLLSFIEQSDALDLRANLGRLDDVKERLVKIGWDIASVHKVVNNARLNLRVWHRKVGWASHHRVALRKISFYTDELRRSSDELVRLNNERDELRSYARIISRIVQVVGSYDVKGFVVASLRQLFSRQSDDFVSLDSYLSDKAKYLLDNAEYFEKELCTKKVVGGK